MVTLVSSTIKADRQDIAEILWPVVLNIITLQVHILIQVGNGQQDHGYWGRPEDMHMWRPAYKITPGRPGSDVAGTTAAALAVGYTVFKDKGIRL
jgi:hypothetical protein